MTYALTITSDADRAVVVQSLREGAGLRTRTAQGAATRLAAAKGKGRDVRSSAVKVTLMLADAAMLTALADELEHATEVPVLAPTPAGTRPELVLAPTPAGPRPELGLVVAPTAPTPDDDLEDDEAPEDDDQQPAAPPPDLDDLVKGFAATVTTKEPTP